jgi:uncharacterized membrane protein YcaP (DUF421 family)
LEKIIGIDFADLIVPTHSLLEMFVRGTIMYLSLVLILRFVMKRRIGALSVADLLVLVVIADAAQNAFSKEYRSLSEGLVLILTIVGWDYVLDRLGYRYLTFRNFLHTQPLLLVEDGKLLKRNMAQESLTNDELMIHLRHQGVEDIEEVKAAYLEDDGQISVIRKNRGKSETRSRKNTGKAGA